jgi:hypothetical protein
MDRMTNCVDMGGVLWGAVRIPRDGEQSFHGIVNTDSTAT